MNWSTCFCPFNPSVSMLYTIVFVHRMFSGKINLVIHYWLTLAHPHVHRSLKNGNCFYSMSTKLYHTIKCHLNYSTIICILADISFPYVVQYSIYITEASRSLYRIRKTSVKLEIAVIIHKYNNPILLHTTSKIPGKIKTYCLFL